METVLHFVFPWKSSHRKVDPSRPEASRLSAGFPGIFPSYVCSGCRGWGPVSFSYLSSHTYSCWGGGVAAPLSLICMKDDWKAAFLLNAQILLHARRFSQKCFVIFPGRGSHATQSFALFSWKCTRASWEARVGNKNKIITVEPPPLPESHTVCLLSICAKCITHSNLIPQLVKTLPDVSPLQSCVFCSTFFGLGLFCTEATGGTRHRPLQVSSARRFPVICL